MSTWSKLFRAVAFLLVLYVGVDIVTCDGPGSSCSSFSSQDKHSVPTDSGDNCICCCAHPVIVPQIAMIASEKIIPTEFVELIQKPIAQPSEIEHPPQLS